LEILGLSNTSLFAAFLKWSRLRCKGNLSLDIQDDADQAVYDKAASIKHRTRIEANRRFASLLFTFLPMVDNACW
jgi:hypothetical protein